ncbi:MAG TPA: hypothetical protein VFB58_10250 [Chloroflexota bacterium]|nr:hypothetical protein [Chloroflexota bacterium]
MRTTFAAFFAMLVLAGCGTTSAQSPSATATPPPPRPTATPPRMDRVLLSVGGKAQDYKTKAFHAAHQWEVGYTQNCAYVANMDPSGGIFQIYGDNPTKPNSAELGIVYSLSRNGYRKSGVSTLQSRGNWKLHILAAPGCSWHVTVREAS